MSSSLLLDTQMIIWGQISPRRIPHRASAAIAAATELCFSSVSVWEMIFLLQERRLPVTGEDPFAWAERAVDGMREIVLDRRVAATSRRLETTHRDPMDRFIAATAIVHNLTLVTTDAALLAIPGLQVLRL